MENIELSQIEPKPKIETHKPMENIEPSQIEPANQNYMNMWKQYQSDYSKANFGTHYRVVLPSLMKETHMYKIMDELYKIKQRCKYIYTYMYIYGKTYNLIDKSYWVALHKSYLISGSTLIIFIEEYIDFNNDYYHFF